MTNNIVSNVENEVAQNSFLVRVYGWMALALAITGMVAMAVASSETIVSMIYGNILIFYVLLGLELVLVFSISRNIKNISASAAAIWFLIYSALNGLTFSVIFLIYTNTSIAETFLISAGTFGIMSIYGYFTKTDLTTIGNLCFLALIGLIIATIFNLFVQSDALYYITTYAGVLIFVGLTAYDTQKIKNLSKADDNEAEESKKGSIMGALSLYLDLINIFLLLLRLFGRRR